MSNKAHRLSPRAIEHGVSFRAGEVTDIEVLLQLDQEASVLFEQAGLFLDLPVTHEFPRSERARIHASLAAGTAVIAVDPDGQVAGFAALGRIDDLRYIEQLSVRPGRMRRGIGTALLDLGCRTAGTDHRGPVWLTTYDHLPWNRPFYERQGFIVVPEADCEPGIRRELDFQRRWLPEPEWRVAMRRSS